MYGRVGVLQMNKTIQQSKWTEDWINIESISNGMIVLPNQEKVSGVKITPKNIFILDEDSQASTLIALRNFYNTLDYEFWLVVADRPVDISMYLSQLQLQYQKETNPQIRKLINQDIQNNTDTIAKKQEAISKMAEDNEKIDEDIKAKKELIETTNAKIAELSQNLANYKEERENKNLKAEDLEKSIEDEYHTLDVLHDQATKLDVKKSKLEQHIEDIQNKMWEDYETTPNTATNYAEVDSHTNKEVE